MTIEKAIEMLRKEYERAQNTECVINPLAFALYRVWKKADEENIRRKEQP